MRIGRIKANWKLGAWDVYLLKQGAFAADAKGVRADHSLRSLESLYNGVKC